MVGIDPLSYGRWWVYKHPKLVLELNKVSMNQNFGWHEVNYRDPHFMAYEKISHF